MNAKRYAALLGLWLACGGLSAAETPPSEKRPQLILAPIAAGSEFRIVEVGGNESRALPAGLAGGPCFPNWRDKGRRLVFCSAASGRPQIYSLDVPGGAPRNLTNTSTNEDQATCSPDGTKILFTSLRDGNAELYVMDGDGRNPVNLTHNPGFDADPAWSPDGKRIAFASDRSGRGFHLMVMNADGSEPRNVIERNLGGMLYPCWSPDGLQIAVGGLVQPDVVRLHVVNADGAGLQELTEGPGMSLYPAWSPDGRYIAYVHLAKHPSQCPEGGRVMLIDLEEGSTREFGAGAPAVTASRMDWVNDE